VTKVSGDTAHGFPQFLPDGNRFLYFVENPDPNVQGVYASSLDSPQERKLVVRTAAKALYTPPLEGSPGYLLWMREQTLFAQRFDAGNLRLDGDPVQLAQDIALGGRRAAFWASTAGVLGYRVNSAGSANLLWIGRDGKRQASVAPEGSYSGGRLSPDATRFATRRGATGSTDIWLLELARNTWTRFTFDPKNDQSPVWSPDGRQIAFSSDRSGYLQIYRKESAGVGQEEQLTSGPGNKYMHDWSPDGHYLMYMQIGSASSFDLWALPLEGDRKPVSVFPSPLGEVEGRFSPNGKWIAYQSDESGKFEIYVQAFPGAPSAPKGKWQVSVQSGTSPVWRGDGKELFFLAPGSKMMAAGVRETASGLAIDTPRELFSTTAVANPGLPYDVTPDGQRFLVVEPAAGGNSNPLTVIVNWQAGLKK
jgi:Tol biopolymer transport system component